MRRIFAYITFLCCMIISFSVSAAQVTDAKWGVDSSNVLRIVVDVNDNVTYNVEHNDNALTLTVNAPFKDNISQTLKVRSSLAPTMQIIPSGEQTLIKLSLTKAIKDTDYKVFALKQDSQTKRPFRVVMDITANKNSTSKVPAAVGGKTTSGKVVVSNRPVTGNTSVTLPAPVTVKEDKPVVKQEPKEEKREKNISEKQNKKDYATTGGLKGKVIVIDPGHGGSDPGAIGAGGTKEKEITLAVSKKLEEILKKQGAKVYMTRNDDRDVYGAYATDAQELQARVSVAEQYNADLFVSLHINSSVNKNIGGFTSYYYPKTSNDYKLAKAIQDQLTANFGVDDLGVREANFYVIKRISMPATLLELCFISNPKEEKLMNSKWFQNKTAKLIAEGIEDYFK